MDNRAMFKIGYGLYVLTAREGERDNGCIINAAIQVTSTPNRIAVTVNKQNKTHDMIASTGEFNLSILTTQAPFSVFKHFGFQTGRDTDKFDNLEGFSRAENGVSYIAKYTNSYISGKVIQSIDLGTHTMFISDVTEAEVLSSISTVTYDYYQQNIKPKPQPKAEVSVGYRCEVCGYIYEGEVLPEDFVCPVCKHGVSDFVKLS